MNGNWRCASAFVLVLTGALSAHASALVDQVVLVPSSIAANTPLPEDSNHQSGVTFTVTQAGSYMITVTDQQVFNVALAALSVSVSSSTASAAVMNVDGTTGVTTASQTVTLAPGTYTVQPLATAAPGSPGGFSVAIGGPGSFSWQDVWVVSAASVAPVAGQSILSAPFNVSSTGSYTLTVTDQSFPVALQSVELILLNQSGMPVPGTPIQSFGATQLSLSAGSYELFVVAQASSPQLAGLYTLQIASNAPGVTAPFAAAEPVGQLAAPIAIANVPASDALSVQVNDLAYPAALGSLQALVTEGASVLQQVPASTAGNPVHFQSAAAAGTVQVFVLAQPGAGGQGSLAVYAADSTGTLADIATPVLGSSSYGYAYSPASALTAATYQLGLNDYAVPVPFASLSAAAEQRGALLTNSKDQGAGNSSTFTTQAGAATILAFPTLQAAGDDSLFGVVLSSLGIVAFNTTQGVGASFSSTSVDVPSSGIYVLQATDLSFPAAFNSLFVIMTSGQTVAGEVNGTDQIPVTLNAAGTYVLNVLAQVGTGANYGLYGLNFAQAQAPTATLTATPTSVASGGQTLLTWSSTNATSCTASNGWSGTLALSGSQQSPAVTATTTFAIACTGAGGTANESATVTLTPSKSGGGGALNADTLSVLFALTLWMLWRRRSI